MQVITKEKKQWKYFFAVGECPEVDRVVPQKKSEHYFIKSNVYNMKLMLRFSNMVLGYMFICQSSMKVFLHAPVNENCCEDTSDRAIFNANPRELHSLIVIKVIIA